MLTSALDKVPQSERDTAHTAFQSLAFAYAILSDERRRKRYDTTGSTSESLDLDDDNFDWISFFRNQYADIVTGTKLDSFKLEYQGSEEEQRALLEAFTKSKGNMHGVYSRVMMSNPLDDEERFRQIIDKAIEAEEVEAFSAYVDETEKSKKARMNRARKEAKEAEELGKEQGVFDKLYGDGQGKPGTAPKQDKKAMGAEADLAAMIQQRQKSRSDNFLNDLEAKYMKGKKFSAPDEPPEEAFEKMAKKSTNRKKKDQGKEEEKAAEEADTAKNGKRGRKENNTKKKNTTTTKRKTNTVDPDPETAENDSDDDENEDIDLALSSASNSDPEDKDDQYDSEEGDQEEDEKPPNKKAKANANTNANVKPTKTKARAKPQAVPIRKGRPRVLKKRKA